MRSLPWAAIIPAHMLWIETKAETAGQDCASASMTSTASSRVRPAPPIASGTSIPAKPSPPAASSRSRGMVPAVSQSSAKGAIRWRPKARAMSRIVACSSDRAKSIGPLYSIVGIEKAAPSLMPLGQREVTVLVRV